MGTGFWYGRWFPVLLPAQRCATLARADAIIFVADAQRALWSSCDHGTFHTVRGRPHSLAEDDVVTMLDFEAVAAAAETALREKLALEVKARPQVPPAALFKPDVKRASSTPKKKKKRLGHRHEHRRRLTATAVRDELAIPQDAFVLTTIGTICRRKRQKWALYALRYLVQKKIDAYYVLVGAPSAKGGQGGSCPVSFVRSRAPLPHTPSTYPDLRRPRIRRRVPQFCAKVRPPEPGAISTLWRFCGALPVGRRPALLPVVARGVPSEHA